MFSITPSYHLITITLCGALRTNATKIKKLQGKIKCATHKRTNKKNIYITIENCQVSFFFARCDIAIICLPQFKVILDIKLITRRPSAKNTKTVCFCETSTQCREMRNNSFHSVNYIHKNQPVTFVCKDF